MKNENRFAHTDDPLRRGRVTRLGVLITDPQSPTVRYRITKYVPFLENAGIRCSVFRFPRGRLARWRLFARLRRLDVVMVVKRVVRPLDLMWLRRCARRLVYDVDDALMFREDLDRPRSALRRVFFDRMLRSADAVICGNDLLKLYALVHNPDVTVLPTSIDLSEYPVRPRVRPHRTLTLGWIGGSGSLRYLEAIRPALERVGREGVRLKILCNRFPEFEHVAAENVLWSEATEVEELGTVDVGIMPLPDAPYTVGKCAFKIVQYFGLALPAIASPVGANKALVIPGISGLLAESLDEWVSAIRYCSDHREQIPEWGLNGRRIVEAGYTIQANAPKMAALLHRLASTGGVGGA